MIYLIIFCALYIVLGENVMSFKEHQVEVFCLIDLKLRLGAYNLLKVTKNSTLKLK